MEKTEKRINIFVFLFTMLSILLSATSAQAIALISDEETEIFLHQTLRPIFKASGTAFNPRRIYIVNDKSLNAFVADGNNMFVTVGTLMTADSQNEISGVLAHETGHIEGGHLLRHKIQAKEVQMVSLASMLLGSAAGIAAGGRTGLCSVSTAFCFALAAFLSPLAGVVTAEATAPALIIVGMYLLMEIRKVDFSQMDDALPAFLTIIAMPFAYSITTGIAVGILAYVICKLAARRWTDLNLPLLILAMVFLIYFFL